jgi:hypothetical protein
MAPAWQDSFHVIESGYCGIEAPPGINHMAVMELASILNDWPVLVHALPEVYLNDDMEAAQRRAVELWTHVEKQLDRIRALGAAQIKDAIEGGAMYEVVDPTLPLGVAYDFDLLEVWATMISYYVTILIFMRMSYDLGLFLGTPDDALYNEYRAMCAEATMVIPFIRRRGKLACKFYGPGMNIAYEGAEQADREYIRDFFIEANDYMHAPKLDEQTAHRYMIYAARCMTGRQSWDVSPGRKWSDYDKF